MKHWGTLAAWVVGLLAVGVTAQTGAVLDLGNLLAAQKNLSTFYGLIQVCFRLSFFHWFWHMV